MVEEACDGRREKVSPRPSVASEPRSIIDIFDLVLAVIDVGVGGGVSFRDSVSNLSMFVWTFRVVLIGLKRSSIVAIPCLIKWRVCSRD